MARLKEIPHQDPRTFIPIDKIGCVAVGPEDDNGDPCVRVWLSGEADGDETFLYYTDDDELNDVLVALGCEVDA